ncbi:hypothetical protein DSUL_60279 [Desulfovibrionales bacterium]
MIGFPCILFDYITYVGAQSEIALLRAIDALVGLKNSIFTVIIPIDAKLQAFSSSDSEEKRGILSALVSIDLSSTSWRYIKYFQNPCSLRYT